MSTTTTSWRRRRPGTGPLVGVRPAAGPSRVGGVPGGADVPGGAGVLGSADPQRDAYPLGGGPLGGGPLRGDPLRGDPLRGDPLRGDPLRRAAAAVLWPMAALALVQVGLRSALGPARDLDILWRAGVRLLAGEPLYDPERAFIYPPLAGWVLAPLGALPFRVACVVLTLAGLAALVAAVVVLLGLVGVPSRSPITAGVLLVLALSRPVDGLLWQGNVDVILVLAEVLVIRGILLRQDVAVGLLLGLVCAVKPTLAPLALGTLMLGRVRATVVAGVVGLGLTLLGFAAVPDAAVFLTDVLPMLGDGNREVLRQYDKSLNGAGEQLGLPPVAVLVLRAAALAVALAVAWRRRDRPLAPLEVMPVLLLGGLLASSFSWANYSLYLLPLLVTVLRPGSLVRGWPAWAGVFLLWTADDWPPLGLGETVSTVVGLRPLWGWVLLLACGAWVAVRGTPPLDRGGRRPAATLHGTTGRGETHDGHTHDSHTRDSHTGDSHTSDSHTSESHTSDSHTRDSETPDSEETAA